MALFTIEGDGSAIPDYTTFPRQFLAYRWYKPLLVALLAFVFVVVFSFMIAFAGIWWVYLEEGTISLNLVERIAEVGSEIYYTGPGALMAIGGVAVMLPALALAALIVRDRPFSSYSSSRGGWNWGAFLKCIGVAIVVYGLVTAVQLLFFPDPSATGKVAFTTVGFILCTVLVPFQCLAEEYVFRGLVLQTFGAWTKLPVVAILASAFLFTIAHGYNLVGLVAIFVGGIVWGVLAWQTRGIEATGAAHIVNNLSGFYLVGIGVQSMSNDIDLASMVIAIAIDILYGAAVLLLGRRFNWFTSKGDGTAKANERYRAKQAANQQFVPVVMTVPQPPMPQQVPQPVQQIPQAYQQQLYQQQIYQPQPQQVQIGDSPQSVPVQIGDSPQSVLPQSARDSGEGHGN